MKALFVGIFTLAALVTKAQDLVVTPEGDSINCRITQIKKDLIYFRFNHKGETRTTLIPLKEARGFQYNYYTTTEISNDDSYIMRHSKLRIALNGGLSLRTAPLPDGLNSNQRQYLRQLKSGVGFGADIGFFFSESIGVGASYSVHKSTVKKSDMPVEDSDGFFVLMNVSDKITMNYIGPTLFTRFSSDQSKGSWISHLSLGYLTYKDASVVGNDYLLITGSTLGAKFGVGYDIPLSKEIGLGLEVSFVGGTLSEITVGNGYSSTTISLDKENYEGLSRVDLTLGIRFYK